MAKVKGLFYLPLRDNDGRDLRAEIEEARFELYLEFVGWTFLGLVNGTYQMKDGSQGYDEHEAYAVILDESRVPLVSYSYCTAG